MSKMLFLGGLKALCGSSALFSLGAGSYILASGEDANDVVEPGHPLITFHKAQGNWERTEEFTGPRFYFRCSGSGHWGAVECIRFMKVKNQGEKEENRIFLYIGEPTQGTSGWPIYKFIYKSDIEKGVKEYQGQCEKNGREDNPKYLCSNNNLPDGWTKELVRNLD